MFTVPTNTKQWIRGLVQAVVQSAASAGGVILVAPETFNLAAGLPKLLEAMVVFAIVGLLAFLKTHPVPDSDPNTIDS